MSELSTFFQNVKLPVISEVAHALIQSLDNEDVSAKEISALIARDPSLTAKLLRLANSARFGASREVRSLDDAIAMAGMAHVRTLALAACFAETFPDLPGLDSDEFWKSSMACAGYAKWLAGGLGADGQDAWLGGMMVRLGELLIFQAAPTAFAEIEELPHLPGARWQREQRLLGFSEGQITAELCHRWNFPKAIVEALEWSSDPMAAPRFSQLAGIVHLASRLADTPSDDPEIIDTLPDDVMQALQSDRAWMKKKFPAHSTFSAAA